MGVGDGPDVAVCVGRAVVAEGVADTGTFGVSVAVGVCVVVALDVAGYDGDGVAVAVDVLVGVSVGVLVGV